MLILASRSPRRLELLKLITEEFIAIPSLFDEKSIDIKEPFELVRSLSLHKAQTVLQTRQSEGDIIIGCDTVVSLNGEIFGIPQSKEEAYSMISKLSGNLHSVITGVCVLYNGTAIQFECETRVTFLRLEDKDILDYIDTAEPYDKAGGYGIQGKAGLFVEKIDGDYSNVVGLPVSKLNQILKNLKSPKK